MGRKIIGSADLADWVKRQKGAGGEKQSVLDERAQKEEDRRPSQRGEQKVEEVPSPLGPLLPEGVYAHFLLIDIASAIKSVRGVPQYFQINQTRTLIGSYVNAHIRLDDPDTVEKKHAKVVYEEKGEFSIYPIGQSRVSVNGEVLGLKGKMLKDGDRVQIGSADLILFHKDLRED